MMSKAPLYVVGEEITMTSREEVEELCNFCNEDPAFKVVTTVDEAGDNPEYSYSCAEHRDRLPSL